MKNKYRRMVGLLILLPLISTPVFSKKITELPDVLKPSDIRILGNRMYVVDDYSILLYSLPDFKLVKKFLKKGNGPGEAPLYIFLTVLPDKLVINTFGKFLLFSLSGEYIGEMKVDYQTDRFCPVGNNYVGARIILDPKHKRHVQYIKLYDKNIKEIRDIYKGSIGSYTVFFSGESKKQDFEVIKDSLEHFVYEDRIYIADTTKGFFFAVFDSDGNQLYEINNPYEKHKVTDEYKEKVTKELEQSPGAEYFNFVFRDFFPAFKSVLFADDRIYLTTHPYANDRCEIIVMDLKGKILKKSTVPDTHLFTVDKGKFYYLEENIDEDIWELKVEEI